MRVLTKEADRSRRTPMWVIGVLVLAAASALASCGDGTSTERTGGTTPTPPSSEPSHLAAPDPAVSFTRGTLVQGESDIFAPTTLAFGPDGRLYVGQLDGAVVAFTLDGMEVVGREVIVEPDVSQSVLGIAFSPTDPPAPLTIYVSHSEVLAGLQGAPFSGTVSKLVAPQYQPVEIITGLPTSTAEHATNGIAFDSEGRLYIAQAGMTNAGVPSDRFPRPETPLSGAILLADVEDPAFDGEIVYDPPDVPAEDTKLVAGDVRVFASGLRNPYDLVLHSNGMIYATDNGPNEADGARSLSCTSEGDDRSGPDELNLVVEGEYYGHPNRNRGRTIAEECVHERGESSSGTATSPIATLGYFVSANGMAEYKADAFGGRLRGNLIYVEWVTGRIWRVVLSDDGTEVVAVSRLVPDVLRQPIDVAVGPDGTVFVAELDAGRITHLTPDGGSTGPS
jgi:glucose/arabinose dehydrogenase